MSAPMGDFKKDPKFEVVYENGRPSYFREKPVELKSDTDAATDAVTDAVTEQRVSSSSGYVEDGKNHSSESGSSQQDANGTSKDVVNPFLGCDNPMLDPKSAKFSAKLWLETVTNITSSDPDRYPKRVAGIAYKNLSAHGYGNASDYQRTFGNYPLKLISFLRGFVGEAKATRVQILRDFDGLVRSGEMLVVLGRPGRFVHHRPNLTKYMLTNEVAVRHC